MCRYDSENGKRKTHKKRLEERRDRESRAGEGVKRGRAKGIGADGYY